jgi:hypothetical protein
LTHQIPPEQLPAETDQIKFVKLQSKLLAQFHGRNFFRAGIILPRSYAREPSRRYPSLDPHRLEHTLQHRHQAHGGKIRFPKTWHQRHARIHPAPTRRRRPSATPHYVNSANNGPYGDALIQELIPHVESRFRTIGQPRARVLSGTSTGGCGARAQVFHPDFFNGAWSSP